MASPPLTGEYLALHHPACMGLKTLHVSEGVMVNMRRLQSRKRPEEPARGLSTERNSGIRPTGDGLFKKGKDL